MIYTSSHCTSVLDFNTRKYIIIIKIFISYDAAISLDRRSKAILTPIRQLNSMTDYQRLYTTAEINI